MQTTKLLTFLAISIASFFPLYATSNHNEDKVSLNEDSVHRQNLFFAELPKAKQIALLQGYLRKNNIDIPFTIASPIFLFVFMPPLNSRGAQYQGKNFTGLDLSRRDFTDANLEDANCNKANLFGAIFKNTNIKNTILVSANLSNTQCSYVDLLQKNIKGRGKNFYEEKLFNDLKSIAKVYPQLKTNTDKMDLLQIACSIARLPYDNQYPEFYIKVAYWTCKLLCFKNRLHQDLGDQLVCSLQWHLNNDANKYCWKTDYPQGNNTSIKPMIEPQQKLSFDSCLQNFKKGLTQYNVQSQDRKGFNWYKETIVKNIEGLAKAYPKVNKKSLQKEMVEIAYNLSKSYELQHLDFLLHFLYHQNWLIRIKNEAGVKASDLYYNAKFVAI